MRLFTGNWGTGGGGGGYTTITYSSMGQMSTNGPIDFLIFVGAGGYGESPARSGANGLVYIEWQ
jgi:hypothetical protein